MNETIGERIKRLREAKGLSQRQMARTTKGVSDAYISHIENNNKIPSLSAIREIAKVLDENPVYIETGQMEYCPHCGSKLVDDEEYLTFDEVKRRLRGEL